MSRFISYLWWLLSKYLYRDLNRSSTSHTTDAVGTPLTICAVLAVLAIGTAFPVSTAGASKAAIAICTVNAIGAVIATHKRLRQLRYIFFVISEEITTPLIPVIINPVLTLLCDHRYLLPSACDGFQTVFLLPLGFL